MQQRRLLGFVTACLFFVMPAAARAADVLQEIPNDALGFVVVHNLAAVDAKVKTLSTELRNNAFSPLEFLKTAAGVHDGLDPSGDFLLAVYKDSNADDAELQFGIWLPVADYAQFAQSIGATSTGGVAAATVAGQDLLIAHRGDWAIVMDPDQKQRITQLAAIQPSPPAEIAPWKAWIASNDVTVVAFAPGVHELWSRLEERFENGKSGNGSSDDLFGATDNGTSRDNAIANAANRPTPAGLAGILSEIHKWTAASPAIEQSFQQASLAGCGLRFNVDGTEHGNVQAKLRVSFDVPFNHESSDVAGLPYSLFESERFVIKGAGKIPNSTFSTLATVYVGRLVYDMKVEERTELDEDSVKELTEAVSQAAAEVRAIEILTQPGEQLLPVYSNDFIAVRVSSPDKFLQQASDVMRLWNKANRQAQGETRLIFENEDAKIKQRLALQYSLDMVALGGDPVPPGHRETMEKMFGPGGKLRLWFVKVDDHTVLLARGTEQQVAAALKNFDRKQAIEFNGGKLRDINDLVSRDATWRVFFDPHRYNDWQRQETGAMIDVPVVGGPLVKPLPECPPVALAGSIQDRELSIEIAALEPTLKSIYDFYSPKKKRPELQRRLQSAPR